MHQIPDQDLALRGTRRQEVRLERVEINAPHGALVLLHPRDQWLALHSSNMGCRSSVPVFFIYLFLFSVFLHLTATCICFAITAGFHRPMLPSTIPPARRPKGSVVEPGRQFFRVRALVYFIYKVKRERILLRMCARCHAAPCQPVEALIAFDRALDRHLLPRAEVDRHHLEVGSSLERVVDGICHRSHCQQPPLLV